MRNKLSLTVKDINRIVRYLPKVNQNNIDYYHFLNIVERVDLVANEEEKVSDISEFAEKLANYLKKKGLTLGLFLKKVTNV